MSLTNEVDLAWPVLQTLRINRILVRAIVELLYTEKTQADILNVSQLCQQLF